jgi:hypothetical protein
MQLIILTCRLPPLNGSDFPSGGEHGLCGTRGDGGKEPQTPAQRSRASPQQRRAKELAFSCNVLRGLVFVTAVTAVLTTVYILPEPEDAKKPRQGGRSDQFVILLGALADQQTDRCLIAYTRRGGFRKRGCCDRTRGSSAYNNQPVADML